MEDTDKSIPKRLAIGPDGRRVGCTPEECREMAKKGREVRTLRRIWKESVRKRILNGEARPSDIIREIFSKELSDIDKKVIGNVKLFTFLKYIPNVGNKKAEAFLVVAQIPSNPKYRRRMHCLKNIKKRERLINTLDMWYDHYQMEKKYKLQNERGPRTREDLRGRKLRLEGQLKKAAIEAAKKEYNSKNDIVVDKEEEGNDTYMDISSDEYDDNDNDSDSD